MSSVPLVAPHSFHVAVDAASVRLSQAFWTRPSNVDGASFLVKVGHAFVAQRDRCGRVAAIAGPSRIQYLNRLLREEQRKVVETESVRLGPARRIFGRIAVKVGQDQLDMAAVAQRSRQ